MLREVLRLIEPPTIEAGEGQKTEWIQVDGYREPEWRVPGRGERLPVIGFFARRMNTFFEKRRVFNIPNPRQQRELDALQLPHTDQ